MPFLYGIVVNDIHIYGVNTSRQFPIFCPYFAVRTGQGSFVMGVLYVSGHRICRSCEQGWAKSIETPAPVGCGAEGIAK